MTTGRTFCFSAIHNEKMTTWEMLLRMIFWGAPILTQKTFVRTCHWVACTMTVPGEYLHIMLNAKYRREIVDDIMLSFHISKCF